MASAWITGEWRCPQCGGDCFGSAESTLNPETPTRVYICHGHSQGQSETGGCGYGTVEQPPPSTGFGAAIGRLPHAVAAAGNEGE